MPSFVYQRSESIIYDLQDLGALVAARRKELGFTLDEASQRLGVGRRLLSELEHGKRSVGADTLLRILNLFGFDVLVRSRRIAANA